MLPKVAATIPLGALLALAGSLGVHRLAPEFELAARGRCLGVDATFGPCADAARLFLWAGNVRVKGSELCLTEEARFGECPLYDATAWTAVADGPLCHADGPCIGRARFGKHAIATKAKRAARARSREPTWDGMPTPKELITTCTYGATAAAGLAFLILFFLDLTGMPKLDGAPATLPPQHELDSKNGALTGPDAAKLIQARARGHLARANSKGVEPQKPDPSPMSKLFGSFKLPSVSVPKLPQPSVPQLPKMSMPDMGAVFSAFSPKKAAVEVRLEVAQTPPPGLAPKVAVRVQVVRATSPASTSWPSMTMARTSASARK